PRCGAPRPPRDSSRARAARTRRARSRARARRRARARCRRARAALRSSPARTPPRAPTRCAAPWAWPSALLFAVRLRGLAHPSPLLGGLAPRAQPVAVADAPAAHDAPELVPVDRPGDPVTRGFVEAQLGIGNHERQRVPLGHGQVDEPLAQLVVRLLLHAPG